MTLFGQVLPADAAVYHGLAWAKDDGGQDELVDAAVDFACPSADAPRALVRTIKVSMRATATLAEHAHAAVTELTPQVASIATLEFQAKLAAMKARISSRD